MSDEVVTVQVINGRSYVDILSLIRVLETVEGDSISKQSLLNNLWKLEDRGREALLRELGS